MKKVHLKSEQLEKNQFMLVSEVNMQTCFVKSLKDVEKVLHQVLYTTEAAVTRFSIK